MTEGSQELQAMGTEQVTEGAEMLEAGDMVFHLFLTSSGQVFYLDHPFTINEIMFLGGRAEVRLDSVAPRGTLSLTFEGDEGTLQLEVTAERVTLYLEETELFSHAR